MILPTTAMELIAIAAVYATFTLLLQRRLANVDKMYEIRARMNEGTKRLTEIIKNKASKEEIAEKQKEVMAISSESMKLQLRSMIVILPLFLILYYFLLPLKFNLSSTLTILSYTISYHTFFIAILFVIGILLSIGFSMYDRRRLGDKYKFGLMQPSFKDPQV